MVGQNMNPTQDHPVKRNVISAETEDGETYAYIFTDAYYLEIKRCVMADAWNKDLSLSLQSAKSICQEIVNLELRMIAETKTQSQQPSAVDVHVRWTIRRDLPAILAIEQDSFPDPWQEDEFIRVLRNRKCISMVAETPCGRIVGYMAYEFAKKRLEIINFAVHPGFHRCGVGSLMVRELKRKLTPGGRTQLTLVIRETNLDGQLFFRSQGFLAKSVFRNHCEADGYAQSEDAFLMEYRIEETARVASV